MEPKLPKLPKQHQSKIIELDPKDYCYYQDGNGDYLSVEMVLPFNLTNNSDVCYEGDAPAIKGQPNSMCGSSFSKGYLQTCKRVAFEDIPVEWKSQFEQRNELGLSLGIYNK